MPIDWGLMAFVAGGVATVVGGLWALFVYVGSIKDRVTKLEARLDNGLSAEVNKLRDRMHECSNHITVIKAHLDLEIKERKNDR